MKQIILVFLFCIFTATCLAQVKKIVIADATDKNPLLVATVKVLNTNMGCYSDKDGILHLNTTTDSVRIEYSGYIAATCLVPRDNDTIFLMRKIKELPGVTIVNYKKKHQFGTFNYSRNYTADLRKSVEFAVRIDVPNTGGYRVQSLFIPLKFKCSNCYCKLHLYNSDSNGFPGEDLLMKPVVLDETSFTREDFVIDVSQQEIVLTDKTLFIGIECLLPGKSAIPESFNTAKGLNNTAPPNSPIVLYCSKAQFFDTSPNHCFFRPLNSEQYNWTGSGNSPYPPHFSAGLTVLAEK